MVPNKHPILSYFSGTFFFLTSQMSITSSAAAYLVPNTEYTVKRAGKISGENGPKLLMWLHKEEHSLFCICPTEPGCLLNDPQIEHVNNGTRILTAIYIGSNHYGEHIFQIRDPTMPVPTQVEMVAL